MNRAVYDVFRRVSVTGFVEIGSVGWEHERWVSTYYPEDLPSDWLFSYYSKQFRTVWLTATELVNKTTEDLQGLIDDCDQGFEFLLEIPEPGESQDSQESLQRWVEASNILKEYILAYVIRVSADVTAEFINAMRARLDGNELPDLFLLSDAKNIHKTDELLALENVYEVAVEGSLENIDNAQILMLDYHSAGDMRALGKVLNAFVNQNSHHDKLYCYFKGKPPSYSLMQSAQTIVSLLDT